MNSQSEIREKGKKGST